MGTAMLAKTADVLPITLKAPFAGVDGSFQGPQILDIEDARVFHHMVSANPRMHAIFDLIAQVADSNATVLIEGETGTGKELVARALHAAALKDGSPYVAVNCAALPETLLESELFGHEKGAFTSAISQRKGRFELADGGVIFLDEAGDIPPGMQAKLLRVLQERCFERVGGGESIHVNVRVIAASNRSLPQLVKDGKFREDLFYRLNVVRIDLPPLRERREDIPHLAMHFTEKYAPAGRGVKEISPDAMDVLMRYSWPGNIRELENAIEHACVMTRGRTIQVDNLPPDLQAPVSAKVAFPINLDRPLAEHIREVAMQIERDYLCKALEQANGHIGECAKICGLHRRSIAAKMVQYHLDKRSFKQPSVRRH